MRHKWNKSEKIIWIKLLIFIVICSIEKKEKFIIMNIELEIQLHIEFIDWTMKTINKNVRV